MKNILKAACTFGSSRKNTNKHASLYRDVDTEENILSLIRNSNQCIKANPEAKDLKAGSWIAVTPDKSDPQYSGNQFWIGITTETPHVTATSVTVQWLTATSAAPLCREFRLPTEDCSNSVLVDTIMMSGLDVQPINNSSPQHYRLKTSPQLILRSAAPEVLPDGWAMRTQCPAVAIYTACDTSAAFWSEFAKKLKK